MHEGRLTKDDLGRWVLNRYYYQTRIPIKDALIVSKSEDPAFRRAWLRRIRDHDGDAAGEGGLAQWVRLAEAVGLDAAEVTSCRHVLPGVRFACDAYVSLVRDSSLVVAVASSLTEFFAPDLMAKRIAAWELHYPFVDAAGLAYFRGRVPRARRDSEEAVAFVVAHARTREAQEACVAALIRKTEILWHLLDCVAAASPSATIAAAERRPKNPKHDIDHPRQRGADMNPRMTTKARGHDDDRRGGPAPPGARCSPATGPPDRSTPVAPTRAGIRTAGLRAGDRQTVRRGPDRGRHRRSTGGDTRRHATRPDRGGRPPLARGVGSSWRDRTGAAVTTPAPEAPRPYTLVAELTYRCPLRCAYCSNPVHLATMGGEIDTGVWSRVFAEAEALGVMQVNLTGGEPLLRDDLEDLVAAARRSDLYTTLITSGVPLDARAPGAPARRGPRRCPAVIAGHRRGRRRADCGNRRGCRQNAEVAGWVRELGLPLTLNIVLHRENLPRLPSLIALAEQFHADRLELAHVQYLGWALANRAALLPTP